MSHLRRTVPVSHLRRTVPVSHAGEPSRCLTVSQERQEKTGEPSRCLTVSPAFASASVSHGDLPGFIRFLE